LPERGAVRAFLAELINRHGCSFQSRREGRGVRSEKRRN